MRAIPLILCFLIGLFLQTACNTDSNSPNNVTPNATPSTTQSISPNPETTKSKGRPIPQKATAPVKSTKERLEEKANNLAAKFCECQDKTPPRQVDVCKRGITKISDRVITYLADSLRNEFRDQYNAQVKACK